MAAVSFTEVSKIFRSKSGGVQALDDVSLTIPERSIFGVVGTSGAGKSTLIRMANGLEKPTTGTVTTLGHDVAALSGAALRSLRGEVSMVFQHYNLLNTQSVARNVAMPLILAGEDKESIEKRVRETLDLVGLEERADYLPRQLSGGQRQRVGIARAIVTDPKLLLCDEPTSALDPLTTQQILDLLTRVNEQLGITILLITHEIGVIARIADEVAVMQDGRVIEQGSVTEVFSQPSKPLTRQFVNAVIPQTVPDAVKDQLGDYDAAVRLVYRGGAARSVVSDLADSGVHADILHASDAPLRRETVGTLVLGLRGDATKAIEKLRGTAELDVEVLG